jgi:hypothetical protein
MPRAGRTGCNLTRPRPGPAGRKPGPIGRPRAALAPARDCWTASTGPLSLGETLSRPRGSEPSTASQVGLRYPGGPAAGPCSRRHSTCHVPLKQLGKGNTKDAPPDKLNPRAKSQFKWTSQPGPVKRTSQMHGVGASCPWPSSAYPTIPWARPLSTYPV